MHIIKIQTAILRVSAPVFTLRRRNGKNEVGRKVQRRALDTEFVSSEIHDENKVQNGEINSKLNAFCIADSTNHSTDVLHGVFDQTLRVLVHKTAHDGTQLQRGAVLIFKGLSNLAQGTVYIIQTEITRGAPEQ